ncbi:phage tail assembly chaperone G [Salisediminibacterium selenitireducens]|uniref:Uncharacterized protein n=1 Tax=Bacillus selenitireducens (strain ATCC 700615 / DSM 15326 / MLS10) TaxID=439292 RepID=D6XZF4_BACIE|nr:hypothetical protein [Salisediminibacterium selenitireducens]ADH98328.1 hypothetical protein Bsel_0799 [[Bacillus] selenitireducens MLS10]
MHVTLTINQAPRTFQNGMVSARMLRRTIEITQTMDFDNMSVDDLDTMVGYLVELFHHQFTIDDVYDGLASKDLIPTLIACINEVVGDMSDATTGDEKNA